MTKPRDEAGRRRFADRVLGYAEDAIYWLIAILLVGGAGSVLVSQLYQFRLLREEPTTTVMLSLLDGLLLVFIFVELLFAVRACLRSHEIVAEPFLLVGILACIKEIVVLSVEAAKLLKDGPEFARAVVQIGVLGGLVLLLAMSTFILRARPPGAVDLAADGDEAT